MQEFFLPLVVVKDGIEARSVPVKKVLVPKGVKVADATGRITQQRVWELIQRPQLRLKPQPTHLGK